MHFSLSYPICSHVRAVLVNRALLVTSHWGDLFVCVRFPLRPWWCGAVSVHLLDEKTDFSSSQCPKGPPNFITSRQFAGHLGAQGVEWLCVCIWGSVCVCMLVYMHTCGCPACKNTALMRATKKQRHLRSHDWNTRVSWVLHNLTFSSLKQTLSGNSSTQWKENTNTHMHARGVSSGKS